MLSLHSPFALCLASGSLKVDNFHHYISQNVHFLKASAQAYEFAEDCADNDDARSGVLTVLKRALSILQL